MINSAASTSLNSSVLVLNRFYMAVHVVNVRRAFGLLYRAMAEVVHFEDGQYANYDFDTWLEVSELKACEKKPHDDWVRAVNFEIQVPRVVRLLRYDRVPRVSLRFNRRNLFARDKHLCQYCGRNYPPRELSFDHVKPRSQGGVTSWENVVCCCLKCNVRKGGRTPQQAHMRLISKPKKPNQSPLLVHKLGNPKYESWKTFLKSSSWAVDLT